MWRALFPANHRAELRRITIVQGATDGAPGLEVPVLSEEEALSLLLSGRRERPRGGSSIKSAEPGSPEAPGPAGGDEGDEARRITRALGRVPLALTLAAAHLRASPLVSLRAYADSLEQTGGLQAAGDPATTDAGGDARLPSAAQALEAALRVQVASLSGEAARRALSAAAILGRGAEVPRERIALALDLALRDPDGAPGPLVNALAELEELDLIDAASAPAVRLHPAVQAMTVAMTPDRAAFAEACAERMAVALGDMDRLTEVVAERGIKAALADLHAGILDLGPTRASTALRALHRALETAAPALDGWKRDEEPAALLQGLCNAAIDLRLESMRRAAEAKLRAAGLSYLRKVSPPRIPPLRTILVPGGPVRALAVMASGARAVTASEDGSVGLWDLDAGARLRLLAGHTAPVNDVAVTASGHLAVSASDDGLVRVVRLDTGEIVRTLRGHAAGVTCVALTPDARLVASGARDGGVIVWNPTSWDAPRRLIPAASGPAGGMVDIALTPDGRFLVTAREAGAAHIWDLETGAIAHELVHSGRVRRVEVTAGGSAVLTVAEGSPPRLWDLETGILVRALATEKDAGAADAGVTEAAMTPACSSAVVALREGSIEVWDQKTNRRTHAFEGHAGEVVGIAVTPFAERAVSASSDGTIRVWELALRKERDRGYEDKLGMQRHIYRDPYVAGLAMTADGRLAVSTNNEESCLKVWDVERGRLIRVIDSAGEPPGALAMTPDGRVAVSMNNEPIGRVWDLDRGQVVRSLEKSEGWPVDAAITADGRFLVTSEYDCAVYVRDLQGDGEARALVANDRGFEAIAVTPDGRFAVSYNIARAALKVWDLASGELVGANDGCPSHRESVLVSGDGRRAILGAPPHVTVVDLETGVIERWPEGERSFASSVTKPALTQDGRFAVVSVEDRLGTGRGQSALLVWDLLLRRRVAALRQNLRAR
ncbi:MAG TPA: WD40 repeat domain-containing protein, partial [Polyangiaceae bacterium]|nr:WD40 repeat domain-containing protein [Polyangiaceae bacterium]